MTLSNRATCAVLIVSLASLGCGDGASSTAVSYDTLPGGIVRVTNRSPADSGKWSLELERTIAPGDDSLSGLRDPGDLWLLDDGGVLLVDENPTEVRRFDNTGAYRGAIGRQGDGPGEYRSGWIAARGDTLLVQDPASGRAATFLLSSAASLGIRPTAQGYFYPLGVDGAGRAVARLSLPPDSIRGPVQGFLRIGFDGATLDTVMLPEHPPGDRRWIMREGKVVRFEMAVPMQPADHHAVDPTGGFVTGWNGEYLLRSTRTGRDTLRLFSRPRPVSTVSTEEKARIVDGRVAMAKRFTGGQVPEAALRGVLVASAIPDERPAYDGISVDRAGRTWVRLMSADTTMARFDLFAPDGRWLDVVTVPQRDWTRNSATLASFAKERAGTVVLDGDGRATIRIYKIVRRP
jgi:hypothetical protein